MGYILRTTPGGHGYLDGDSTFPSVLPEGLEAIALQADQALRDYARPLSRGLLTDGVDLNALHTSADVGAWALMSSGTYANAPTTITAVAVLEVERGSGTSLGVVQRVTMGGRLWFREATDATAGTWSAWVEATTRSTLTLNTDVATVQTPGMYDVPTSTLANSLTGLPVPYAGVLEVGMASSSIGFQRYTTFGNTLTAAYAGSWFRVRLNATTWDRWVKIGEAYLGGNIPQPTDLNTFTTPGVFTVNNSTAVSNTTNLPVQWPGTLENVRTPGSALPMQRYTAYGASAGTWWRVASDVAGNWHPWRQFASVSATPVNPAVEHEMRLNDLRRRVGTIDTAGKGVVAIVFDHGTNNFATEVLPALQTRGLRATLALNSDMYNPAASRYASDNATTWTQIKGWHDNDGIEIANHGRTHGDATTETTITTEVVTGRNELEANMPGVIVDSWVQPSSTYGDFNAGSAASKYWSTTAGPIIYGGHAVITGTIGGQPYPLGGDPIVGMSGAWIDDSTAVAGVQSAITAAAAAGEGYLVRMHPEVMNTPGKITTAGLSSFLAWLKVQQDSGALLVLPLRELAVARS